MHPVITDASVVVSAREPVSAPLGDAVVILDLAAGVYFSLDNAGAKVWQLLQQPISVSELRRAILEAYEVSAAVCERDLLALLGDLAARNLIEIRDAAAG